MLSSPSPLAIDGTMADAREQEQIAAVVEKCKSADPHHGPIWTAIAKDPRNVDKSIEQLLKLVGDRLAAEEKQ